MDSLGVYIHIPFCVQKCAYCDFLSTPATYQKQQEYMKALKREILCEAVRYADYKVKTIFFGGGTPSILLAEDINGVIDCVRENFKLDTQVEITIEMNPGIVTREKLFRLKNAGVNRLSIGLQSANDKELKLLGRIHTYEDFLQTYHWAREAGFYNINIDLMSALPGQNMESWVQTLKKVLALCPEHISAYSLIIEEGTRLGDRIDEYPRVPDEEEDRQMYQATKYILAKQGYQRYEISNYAKVGWECKHNKIYWQRGIGHISDFVGFGLGASSTVQNMRWNNTPDMETYLCAFSSVDLEGNRVLDIKENVQKLSLQDCMEEYMFLGLRMMCGVSKTEFLQSFGRSIEAVYGNVLHKWTELGMILAEGDCVRLTDAGIDVSNMILAEFLL